MQVKEDSGKFGESLTLKVYLVLLELLKEPGARATMREVMDIIQANWPHKSQENKPNYYQRIRTRFQILRQEGVLVWHTEQTATKAPLIVVTGINPIKITPHVFRFAQNNAQSRDDQASAQ